MGRRIKKPSCSVQWPAQTAGPGQLQKPSTENICLFSSQRRDSRLKIIQKGQKGKKKNCTQNSKWLFWYKKGLPSSLGRAGGGRPSREAERQQGLLGQVRTWTPAAPLTAPRMRADEVSTTTQADRGLHVDVQWV